jgi:putative Holliday junction resolvase
VSFVDERLSSVRAERAVRGSGLKKLERERKERVDAAAAQLILQAWLDAPGIAR